MDTRKPFAAQGDGLRYEPIVFCGAYYSTSTLYKHQIRAYGRAYACTLFQVPSTSVAGAAGAQQASLQARMCDLGEKSERPII